MMLDEMIQLLTRYKTYYPDIVIVNENLEPVSLELSVDEDPESVPVIVVRNAEQHLPPQRSSMVDPVRHGDRIRDVREGIFDAVDETGIVFMPGTTMSYVEVLERSGDR